MNKSKAGEGARKGARKSSIAAMHEANLHNVESSAKESVPPADDGGHAHSPAAHLASKGDAHTKPEGNLRQGSHPGALREPPMVLQRVGKQNRGQ